MKVTAIPAEQLTPELIQVWADIQQADPELESPYFRPEFTQAVAAVRPGVCVGIIEDGAEPVGFFPFERRGWGLARPVGGPLSDYQGVVARSGVGWTVPELMRGCGLLGWDFDHLLAAQEAFRPYHWVAEESPHLDLSGGFEAYAEARRRAGSTTIKDTLRQLRKAAREVGPVRFEAQVDAGRAPQVFKTLLAWKSTQYRETQTPDVFAFGWPVRLLERILAEQAEPFSGMLSALYFGDRLAAVHLGMRSHGVLHAWFPAFDRELGRYSPGIGLMVELAQAAAPLGIRRIDLGKGKADWKSRLMSGAVPLAEGCVTASVVVGLARGGLHRTRAWVRQSRLGAPARAVARWTRALRGRLRFS